MIVVDTGPLVAIANRRDPDHDRCVEWYQSAPGPLLLPPPVLTEVCYLLEREVGPRAEAAFVRSVRDDEITLETLTTADLDRMAELIETYADFPLGAADASVVAVAERRRVAQIATLDTRHFSVVRTKAGGTFELLP